VSRVAEVFGEPVRRFVGGTHLINAGDERIAYTCRKLQDMGIRHLGACHCTGERRKASLPPISPGSTATMWEQRRKFADLMRLLR
jgi:7,8-dihydropterin-6-yl-methyl-4-(beta-D-ribofuranosyl)aminobenzene 5'-phosphate synthase